MNELFFAGAAAGLALLATVCIAAYVATKQRFALSIAAQHSLTEFMEQENQHLRAEVKRLSSRPPPMAGPQVPVYIPPPPRVAFVSRGSIVPPPPDYLFELPKTVLAAPMFPIQIPSLPPAPPRDFVEDDKERDTLRTDQCEAIARSLRPGAL